MMDFLFTHHLTSYEHRLNYVKYCLNNKAQDGIICSQKYNEVYDIINGLNFYDYLKDCKVPKNDSLKSNYYLRAPWAFKRFKKTNGKILNLIEEQEDRGVPTSCIDDTNIKKYFSREDVQKVLHI